MTQRNAVYSRIRNAKASLDNAEKSFHDNQEVRGELDLMLAEAELHPTAFTPPPMARPRDVHWTASDIYPDRLCSGELLRHIRMADRWSEAGLD